MLFKLSLMSRPLILVTNDDGIMSPGIRKLIKIMNSFGDVIVVAPDSPQSGKSHAITIEGGIKCTKVIIDDGPQIEYSCSGTPVDCVKLAVHKLFERKPDLCVSGINHGSNSSVNVIYSGTMAAAIEGYIEGVPSIGFSLLDFSKDADFSEVDKYIKYITTVVLNNFDNKNICLNVNIPKRLKNISIKGIKVCRQAYANWAERYEEKIDENGVTTYCLTGEFINFDSGKDTDEWYLKNHFITIVPIQIDLTNHNNLPLLNKLILNE